jgi:hypothetical protein
MTGSSSSFSSEYKDYLRRYWEVQVYVGEQIQGWIFWTWKAENADEWSYQKGLEGGWIPKDVEERITLISVIEALAFLIVFIRWLYYVFISLPNQIKIMYS